MNMIDVRHKNIRKSSLPRTGREIDAITGAAGVTGPAFGGGGSSGPRYWDLINTDAEGNALPEGKEYINTTYSARTDGSFVAKGDVIACAADPDIKDTPFPVAGYDMAGIVRIKPSSGLIVRDGVLEVDPSFAGGLDEEQLKLYLTNNKYVTEEHLKTTGYITFTSPLAGYKIADKYAPVTTTDTILTAFGKLERNFSNYVDLTTDQLIKGKKTFEETIFSKKDIIASAIDTSVEDISFPIASATRLGCVKVGANLSITTDGVLSALAGGGIAFTPGTALQLTSNDVLNVVFGTTGTTACAGNDSRLSNARPNPYALTFTGFSTGTYTGASSLTIAIPTNNSQLSNGRGYITGITKSMILDALSGSGDGSKYLAGDGTFYTISANEITFPSGYVTLSSSQTVSGLKHFSPGLTSGNKSDVWIQISSGNSISGMHQSSIANLYLNYVSSSKNVRITGDCDIIAAGDIVASATSSSISDIMAVASSSTYGLVKYDNSTIRMNSSGQLYCTTTGGGGNVSVIDNLTSTSTTSALSANQGRILDSRLQNVKFGSNYTDYVVTQLGSTSYNLSKNGHSHAWSAITSKPSWIGSSKPSYSWSEISSKPSVISSITYSISGSGSVVTNVTASGNTVSVTKGNISGSSFNGGTITSNITISRSDPGIALSGSSPFINMGSTWKMNLYSGDFRFMYGSESRAYFSYASSGNMWIKGSLVQGSDMRRKKVIDYLGNVLPLVHSLSVFRFRYNNDETQRIRIGLSAQQVRLCFPEFVYTESDGYYSLDYPGMTSIAIQGVKELYTKHQKLESDLKSFTHWKTTKDQQIDFLMKENACLKARVNELERRVA